MALRRVAIPSPNYSSRAGAPVRLIVLHTSEGAQTYQSLGNFFANPANPVSSHVGIDDTAGTIGEYVPRSGKAWTAGNANPVAVQAELCTPSGAAMGWSAATWQTHPNMLANAAAWVAEEAAAFGVPIVKLSAAQAQSSGRGVCQHADLGAWGGGHTDCGPNFPIDQVLQMAAGGQPGPSPTPPPPEESEDMPAPVVFNSQSTGGESQDIFFVDPSGNLIHAYYSKKSGRWSPRETLARGWDPKGQLSHSISPNGADQVWQQQGASAMQCYWSAAAAKWVPQALA